MANVYCVKCGLTGDSKCPYCRNIRADVSDIGFLDTMMSYRLKISDEGILIKRYSKENINDKETNHDMLLLMKRVLNQASDEEVKVLGCIHEWDFEPCNASDISCGHGKDLRQFMLDVSMYLIDAGHVAQAEMVMDKIDEIEKEVTK